MNMTKASATLALLLLCPMVRAEAPAATAAAATLDPREVHLSDLRQLTFGGENAEGYFSFDGRRLSLQATTAADRCDQIYTINLGDLGALGPALAGAAPPLRRVSDGR